MISSGAIKPKRQPVLSKSAQDRKDQLYVTLRKHPVLDPVIAIVADYDRNVFVPHQVFKFKDEDRFIIITKPQSNEIDPVDVSKRIAVYYVTPTYLQLLDIKDVRSMNQVGAGDRLVSYSFSASPGGIKLIDLANKVVIIDGVPYDQKFSLDISELEILKSVVSKEILDHLSFLSSPQSESPDTSLVSAILADDAADIRRLIHDSKVNPNSVDEKGVPMLVRAVKANSFNAVRALVRGGADLESRSNAADSNETALLYAVHSRREDMASFLVKRGANVNAQDVNGRTSLFVASGVSLVDFLINRGADLSLTDLEDASTVEIYHYHNIISRLAEYHMNQHAEQRVEHWSYDEKTSCYDIRFKQGLSHNDTVRAWNAIANKIKSERVNAAVGLLADYIDGSTQATCKITLKRYPYVQVNIPDNGQGVVKPNVYYADQVTHEHYAQVRIPDAKNHAIQAMRGDIHGITITLREEYKNDLLVAKKLREIFAKLKIKSAPVADAKVTGNPAAMFAPPGLTVNDKPVLPKSNKLII